MKKFITSILSLFCIGQIINDQTQAAVFDANFTETTFLASPFSSFLGTGMAWAPDGSNRLFILRKGGFSGISSAQVRIVKNGSLLGTPFATESVFTNSECGLIGMAFDPSFASNGYVYFFITASDSEQQIVRYTAVGDIGTNRTVILSGLPTIGNNHDGGGVGIGRDGKLYWTIGDLGNRTGVDLDLTTLAAKAGRANRDGTVPLDNPFRDGPGPNQDFIFAGGMRNPFTLNFQPGTGALWVNIVGDNIEQIFKVEAGDHCGYDDIENGIPGGSPSPYFRYIMPSIKYQTNGTLTRQITATGAVRSSGIVTITTTTGHRMVSGEKVTVSGVSDASFNGSFFIQNIINGTQFSYSQAGPNASSGSPASPVARVQTLFIGGSLTGGTFFDSTLAPPSYRGNYFFGDYNSGNVARATLSPSGDVTSVDSFASASQMIDMDVGPDGALYGLQFNGQILRWAYQPAAQGLVVTPIHPQTDENARIAVSVRLAQAPAANVAVDITRTAGDSDLIVESSPSLTFTPTNWEVPQTVFLKSNSDADAIDDSADFSITSAGLPIETVKLFSVDQNTPQIITSANTLLVPEGGTNSFAVSLSGPPAIPVTINVARTAGDTDLSVTTGASLVFNKTNFAAPQQVVIAASEDGDALNGAATFSLSGVGLTTQNVIANEQDNEIQPYELWRIAKFTPTELADPLVSSDLADPDSDGFKNLLEYALAGEPKEPSNLSPVIGYENGELTFQYTRAIAAADISYQIQESTTLLDPWVPTTLNLTGSEVLGTKVRFTYGETTPSSEPRRFFRLRVTLISP